jgi:hypothetical protein
MRPAGVPRELAARRSVRSITVRDGHGAGFLAVAGPILMAILTRLAGSPSLLRRRQVRA